MAAKARVHSRAIQIALLVQSAQSTVLTNTAAMISVPPIVGVPALDWWLSGPRSRIG